MKEDHIQLHFDEEAVQRTTINLGMWSYVAAVGGDGADARDLIVSGLREGVKYYRFDDVDDEGVPRYERGELIRGLDGWNLNVIPLYRIGLEEDIRPGCLLVKSGGAYVFTDARIGETPRLSGEPAPTGVEGVLDLHRYGRNVSTASVFRRPGAAHSELLVTVVDMSEYYPGEYGVYGGRAIGIDQNGRNIGYDETGKWLGGRGKAELHLFVIETFHGVPDPRYRGRLQVAGVPFEAKDRCGSAAVADFDGDGNLELVVLDAWRFESYRLAPECGSTAIELLGSVAGPNGPYIPDIQHPSPTAIHLPGRELPDLIMGSFSGEVFFAKNRSGKNGTAKNDIDPGGILEFSDMKPVSGRDTELRIGGFAVPALVDLNGDGLLDLVVGDEDGHISYIENIGTPTQPAWGGAKRIDVSGEAIRIVSGYDGNIQGPDERLHGYACPAPYDWTGNGCVDLIVGNITGYYLLYANTGTVESCAFSGPERFIIDGQDLRGEWRVRPAIADFDGDGVPTLVALDTQGMLTGYRKSIVSETTHTALEAGTRFVDNLGRWIRLDRVSGAQGRVKLVACDWTGSGTVDIIVGTGSTTPLAKSSGGGPVGGFATFLLLENVGEPGDPVFITRPLELADGTLLNLGTHSCAAAVGDIDGDGELEIIAGEETGRLLLLNRAAFRL